MAPFSSLPRKREPITGGEWIPACAGMTRKVRIALGLLGVLFAVLTTAPAVAEGVPLPAIPKAKGEKCVEEPQLMRRYHMEFLGHQRDATMRQGIRTTRHSLKECISCHAVDGTDGKPVTIKSEQHFCNACHSYAAVRIDCFQCHASTPEVPGRQAAR